MNINITSGKGVSSLVTHPWLLIMLLPIPSVKCQSTPHIPSEYRVSQNPCNPTQKCVKQITQTTKLIVHLTAILHSWIINEGGYFCLQRFTEFVNNSSEGASHPIYHRIIFTSVETINYYIHGSTQLKLVVNQCFTTS